MPEVPEGQGGKSVLESGLQIRSVCVEVEGYAREEFEVSWKSQLIATELFR
jgi:hypothetical protein